MQAISVRWTAGTSATTKQSEKHLNSSTPEKFAGGIPGATLTKRILTGKNAGKRSIWFNGNRKDKKTGIKKEYCKKQFEKYIATDFSRFH